MAIGNFTAIPPPESESAGFAVLMHRLLLATRRLELAAGRLNEYEDLPEYYIPAACVVEEATLALEQLHKEFDAGT